MEKLNPLLIFPKPFKIKVQVRACVVLNDAKPEPAAAKSHIKEPVIILIIIRECKEMFHLLILLLY